MNASARIPALIDLICQGSFYFFSLIFLLGCLPTPQVKEINRHFSQNKLKIPNQIELTEVPFYPQTKYHCGPSAVATLLAFNQHRFSYPSIVEKVYTSGRKGSLQSDILTVFRRSGYLSYVLQPKLIDLLAEVAAGRPVLVMQNLGIKWIKKWHYAIVVGYNLKTQKIFLRSGKHKRKTTSFKLFERTWKRSNYWAVSALKPGILPARPNALNYLTAAAGLEQVRNWKAAHISYQTATRQWSDNLIAKMGVANTTYQLRNIKLATYKYHQIVKSHPKSADAHNNLASLLTEQKKYSLALKTIKKAIKLGGKNTGTYRQTLFEIKSKLKTN